MAQGAKRCRQRLEGKETSPPRDEIGIGKLSYRPKVRSGLYGRGRIAFSDGHECDYYERNTSFL